MTSIILTPKSNFASVFRQSLKRITPLIISLAVVNLLTAIIGFSITLESYSGILSSYAKSNVIEVIDITEEALIVMGIGCMFCGFFSLFASARLFKEIYSKRACDFYFSMPVKRETYFTANFLLGTLINIIGLIIPVAVYTFIINASNGNVFVFDNEYIAKVFLAVILALLAMFSAFMMCAVISGKKFHYILLSLICLFSPSVVTSGIVLKLNKIWGYHVDSSVSDSISPPINVFNSIFSAGTDLMKYLIVISVIEIIGMFVVGYIVFKNRKAESAEVSLSGRVSPYFLLSVFVLSGFMYANSVANELTTVIIGIVFAVISGLLFSAIFYKKAFTKKTAVTTSVVCIVCIIFVCLVYLPGYDKYVKYVPSADQVEKVEIYNSDIDTYYDSSVFNQLINLGETDADSEPSFTVSSSDSIADVIKLHEKTVADATIEKSKNTIPSAVESLFGDYTNYDTYDFIMVYTLKDGSKVKRTYSVLAECINKEVLELMRNKDVLAQNFPAYNNDNMLFATYENYNSNVYYDDTVEYSDSEIYMYDKLMTVEESDKFVELYMDDLIKASDEEFLYALSNNAGNVFYFPMPYDSYYDFSGYVNFYYIDDKASAEDIEKIRSMTPEEIVQGFSNYDYSNEENPLAHIRNYSSETYTFGTESTEYLKNLD